MSPEEACARSGGELPHFIPNDDSTGEHCESNRRLGEEYLKALLEEVGEYRLIGEDLGVVPDYVRPSLTALGIAGFKIPQWERQPNYHITPGREYPRLSIATYATHDHYPLAVMWEQMRSGAEAGDGHQRWEMEQLAYFAGMNIPVPQPFTTEIHEGLLNGLFQSNAWIAITMITDLFGSSRRFNVPGAVADSNWSERMNRTVAQWNKDSARVAKMERISELLRRSGRV